MAKGSDSAETVAAGGVEMCQAYISKIAIAADDLELHEKVEADIVKRMKAQAVGVVTQVRAWDCLNSPAFISALNLPY